MTTPRAGEARPARRILGSVVAGALLLALSGCGSDGGASGSAAKDKPAAGKALGEKTAGSVAQLAQCRDWNRGTKADKLATIEDIRSQVNRRDSGFEAPPLSDTEAMELFDSACEAPYAQGFRLYILYARGAATAPLVRE